MYLMVRQEEDAFEPSTAVGASPNAVYHSIKCLHIFIDNCVKQDRLLLVMLIEGGSDRTDTSSRGSYPIGNRRTAWC